MWRRACLRTLALAALAGLLACAGEVRPAAVQQDMAMGPFTLRAVSVEAYSRAHQGVPWEVQVMFTLTGGNRFDRAEFAETVSRRGISFQTSDRWHDRGWLLARGDDRTVFALQVNPPLGSHGYTVQIPNPYGKPAAYLLDLGR